MRDYKFFVYLMASRRNGTLYCGVTNDLVRRVVEHRDGMAEGFTRKHGVCELVWFEQHSEIHEAILREKRIKTWNRDWKISLIEAQNPEWRDLAPELGLQPLVDVALRKREAVQSNGRSYPEIGSPLSRG